jgi:hypothetical protein
LVTCCQQHVQETGDIVFVASQRIFHGKGNRTQGRVVQNIIDPVTRPPTVRQLPDVPFNKLETGALVRANGFAYFGQVMLRAGREVIQADYLLVRLQQCLQEIRTEAGRPDDTTRGASLVHPADSYNLSPKQKRTPKIFGWKL